MRPSTSARKLPDDFVFAAEQFVRGAGEIVRFESERDPDPAKIDHFWITIRAGRFGLLLISISTCSLKHAAAGFDPRMRVGVIGSSWRQLPASGLFPTGALDYGELERTHPVVYREMARVELEELLVAKMRRTIFAEAWGALYLRNGLGIHQVHSRRASCSVPTDYLGRDGALRLYYRENSATEMLLFKYCGQV